MFKIDDIDRKIIEELRENAQQSEAAIAETLGLNKQLVNYRIRKLVKSRVILSFNANIDLTMLGYFISMHIFIKTRHLGGEFISTLKAMPNVVSIYKLSGAYDLHVFVVAHSIDEADYLITMIKDAGTTQIHQLDFFFKTHIAEEKKTKKAFSCSNVEKLDKKDVLILKDISRNSKIKLQDLSKKIGLTAETVSIRLRKLKVRKVIMSYKAEADYYKVYNNMLLILIKNMSLTRKQKGRLEHVLNSFNLISMHHYIDAASIILALNDLTKIEQVTDAIKQEFPEIMDISLNVVLGNIKRDWSALLGEAVNYQNQ